MRQMVEEFKTGSLTILQAVANYQVKRKTLQRWLAQVEDEKQRL
jgi:hypothetical protein